MKKNPYANSTGIAQSPRTCGNNIINAAAASSSPVSQRIRPRSLRCPKSGLLIADAAVMPESAMPVNQGSNPRAFCKNNEAEVPIALPAKSRRLKAKLVPRKNSQSAAVGNNRPGLGVSVDGSGIEELTFDSA